MKEMSEDKKQINVINVAELERQLRIKEAIKEQMGAAFQQIIGQITCVKELIRKAKGEDKKPNQKEENKK